MIMVMSACVTSQKREVFVQEMLKEAGFWVTVHDYGNVYIS